MPPGSQVEAVLNDLISRHNATASNAEIVRLASAVERYAPSNSPYVRQVRDAAPKLGAAGGLIVARAEEQILYAATALRDDYAAGYMQTVSELIHAEVFSDMLGMATELQDKGFKDPAAVIAGSVLEEHLRKLADRYGVGTDKADGKPKKADTLNAELEGQGAYNKLEQKSVTAWLDLRNKAAHGKYNEYDAGQVAALIRDVREFMVRHPA